MHLHCKRKFAKIIFGTILRIRVQNTSHVFYSFKNKSIHCIEPARERAKKLICHCFWFVYVYNTKFNSNQKYIVWMHTLLIHIIQSHTLNQHANEQKNSLALFLICVCVLHKIPRQLKIHCIDTHTHLNQLSFLF